MSAGSIKIDSNLTGLWVSFFTSAGIPSDVAATYALTFTENRIQNDMLLDLNKEYLRDMGISRMGDVIAILRHAKQVHESTARDRVLNTAVPKVPVAAVTGRSTTTQPSSPASRILEHYTRRAPESPPAPSLKRKPIDVDAEVDADKIAKRARLIRFLSSPSKIGIKEVILNKTVFSRLGANTPISETVKTVSTKPVLDKAAVKPIYARLGSKAQDKSPAVPIEKDALKYEGILKSTVTAKKSVTVTTSKNNVRKCAMSRTMRADETPVSIKDKLAMPKAKSVKFSNHVQFKEIESKVPPSKVQFTPVFNKPERRLSMPEDNEAKTVKARLGVQKDTKNFTITRNVFNRLGV